ncbi:hypothetical protein CCR75_008169 [Bremia lactucae]|uniref:Uncharacterized protein n=1 Tax=Bremia lactucae TaxID=4779 RepID=A0A976FM63_BRELC|nr:hypothetical protein CCR75_008169 [Bremia lactucae]
MSRNAMATAVMSLNGTGIVPRTERRPINLPGESFTNCDDESTTYRILSMTALHGSLYTGARFH